MALQKGRQVSESLDNVHIRDRKLGEVLNCGAWLIKNSLVDEVPGGLETTPCAFDIIGECCALGKGVILLVHDHSFLALGEGVELLEGGIQNRTCLHVENRLSLSSN